MTDGRGVIVNRSTNRKTPEKIFTVFQAFIGVFA
jgi:hypothetical protein